MICLSIVSSRLHFFHNVNVLQKKKGVILMFSILSYLTFLFLLCNLRCNTHSRTLLVVSGRRPSPIFLVTLLNNCSFPSLNHLSSSHVAPSFSQSTLALGKRGKRDTLNLNQRCLCFHTSQWSSLCFLTQFVVVQLLSRF